MSYYRYITGVYKSYWPELNRTLRSSSVPRHTPELTTGRFSRSSSVPLNAYFTPSFHSHAATPFRDRATSVPPALHVSTSYTRSCGGSYSDFDYKVLDYMGKLDCQESTRRYVSQNRSVSRNYPADSFSAKYNFYDGNKHCTDYLYPSSQDLLGTWKHYNLSADTINFRNQRATSPLITRELNRYFETKKRTNYVGDMSSGGSTDFRYYNYRRVPYFGGSDGYQYMKHYKPNGCRRL
jgi:hypothetical protein